MINHIVIFWTNQPKEDNTKKLIAGLETLRAIEVIKDIQIGTAGDSPRAVVDSSYSAGLSVFVENEQDLQTYLNHPLHLAFAKNVLAPLACRCLVYDIVSN